MIPTLEEYKKAKKEAPDYKYWIDLSNKRIMELIDILTSERESLKTYEECLAKLNITILKYETYEEIAKEKANVND